MSNRRGNGNTGSWGKAADDVEQLSNKKSKNRGGTGASKPWLPQTQKARGRSAGTGNAWSAQPAVGRGSVRPHSQAYDGRGFEQGYNVNQPAFRGGPGAIDRYRGLQPLMAHVNQQLNYYMDKAEKEKRHSEALAESFRIVAEKLWKTMEENRIVRQRIKIQHEQNKEEMDYQEEFFKEKLKLMEENFEKQQQEKRELVMHSNPKTTNDEENSRRVADIESFIKLQDMEMEQSVAEKEKLIKEHEEKPEGEGNEKEALG